MWWFWCRSWYIPGSPRGRRGWAEMLELPIRELLDVAPRYPPPSDPCIALPPLVCRNELDLRARESQVQHQTCSDKNAKFLRLRVFLFFCFFPLFVCSSTQYFFIFLLNAKRFHNCVCLNYIYIVIILLAVSIYRKSLKEELTMYKNKIKKSENKRVNILHGWRKYII